MGRSLLLRPPFSFSLLIQVLFFFSQNASQRKQGKLNMQTLITGYFVVQFTGGGDFQSLKQEVVVADPGLFLIPQFYRSTYLKQINGLRIAAHHQITQDRKSTRLNSSHVR